MLYINMLMYTMYEISIHTRMYLVYYENMYRVYRVPYSYASYELRV